MGLKSARLLYGSTISGMPNFSSDLLWKTGFKAPDPFFLVEFKNGRNVILVNQLEYERAKKEAKNCRPERIEKWVKAADGKNFIDGLIRFLKERGAEWIFVHRDTPIFVVEHLRPNIPTTQYGKEWYPERVIKNEMEIKWITDVQEKTERIMAKVADILQRSAVGRDNMLFTVRPGNQITSEYMKRFIDMKFAELGLLAVESIVACGDQAVDPHCPGSGPLYAHKPIVVDIFPRSKENLYWADITRTFFKGKPSPEAEKMYNAVLGAQTLAISMIRASVEGLKIYKEVVNFFDKNGYKTGVKDGVIQGFFHGVGHGVGIDIHENPRISGVKSRLYEGSVVTVEPGLYYLGIGGVRIEDLVVVKKDGVKNLTKFPKDLDSVIL